MEERKKRRLPKPPTVYPTDNTKGPFKEFTIAPGHSYTGEARKRYHPGDTVKLNKKTAQALLERGTIALKLDFEEEDHAELELLRAEKASRVAGNATDDTNKAAVVDTDDDAGDESDGGPGTDAADEAKGTRPRGRRKLGL